MKSALVLIALAFTTTAVEAAPKRRGKTGASQQNAGQNSAGNGAAAAAANALANLCKPTITCKVGDQPAFVLPRVAPPNVGSDGKIHCRYEVDRNGKQWVGTHKALCQEVPVTQCTNITPVMRVQSASVAFMNSTPQDGKCNVMPRVSLKQK